MFKNYLKVAFRSLRKNKAYITINTFGLGIALACCMAAYMFIAFNIEFDVIHDKEKVKNVFKVHSFIKRTDGQQWENISAPLNLAPAAFHDIAGIENFTRFNFANAYVRTGKRSFSESVALADSSFFNMFDYPLISGSHTTFKDLGSVYLSERTAQKYFGNEDAVGKVLTLKFTNEYEVNLTVAGVLENIPLNNTFVYDIMMRMEHFYPIHNLGSDEWGHWMDPVVFFKLTSAQSASTVGKQLKMYIERRNEAKTDETVLNYDLRHFDDANYNEDNVGGTSVNLRLSFVPLFVFTSLAFMILLIACFNLTNTSIAMSSKRLKEVGVRKVIGAGKRGIATQFMLETLMTITFAMITGLMMAQVIVPAFMEMWDADYTLKDVSGLNLFVSVIFLMFLTALLAGVYPAIFGSRLRPVALLKGSVRIKGTNFLTRTLITVQFAISVIVLIAGVVFTQNTAYQEQINFGYDKDKVIQISIQNEKEFRTMEARLITYPGIELVAVTDHNVGWGTYPNPVKIDTAEYQVWHAGVGKNYFETMGFTLVSGRWFNPETTSDYEGAVVVNRQFLKETGLSEDALNTVMTVNHKRRKIVGIMENYIDNVWRTKDPEPIVFYAAESKYYKQMLVRVDEREREKMQDEIENVWTDLYPDKPFESRLQDDILLQNTRQNNANLKKVFLFLTLLGAILSASGIFALASLNIGKRSKEIGIRKTLGASIDHIIRLLNQEFAILLLLAGIIGAIGGYFLTEALLDEIYAFHIAVGLLTVTLCTLLIIAIGLGTTSFTTLSAARSNPVSTLRDE